MNVIGIFMEGPNTGACLFKDGILVAMAEEERFTRIKRSSEFFPAQSIKYCLREANLSLKDIHTVATGWDHSKYPEKLDAHMRSIPERSADPLADRAESIIHTKLAEDIAHFNLGIGLRKIDYDARPNIRQFGHHQCHAASVHYLSGFDRSLSLVMDGSGEEIATSTWLGSERQLENIENWDLPHSLGWFYAAVTEWLGFSAYSGEGKVMGLAAYGKPLPEVGEKLRQFCIPDEERIYRIDPTYVYYGPRSYSRKYTDKLVDLLGPPRTPEAKLEDYHVDVAYELQKCLEDVAVGLTKRLLAKHPDVHNLCISGGVAMNCKMNGVLSHVEGVDQVFINPASHDSGVALGAALLAINEEGVSPLKNQLTHAYWGPSFTDQEIEDVLSHCQLEFKKSDDIAADAAKKLSEGKIVGWFQGRAEFGARALGGRSILANPMHPEMKTIINAKVKYREGFRPFAPSMIEEVKDRYMIDPKDSPFMILAYQFNQEFKDTFPSIVHVDGSVRPQTVSQKNSPQYWKLIKSFGDITGHPVVLNTSFNIRGEPIVNTPLEAVRCFYSTGMDVLAVGSYLLEKKAP